VLQRNNSAAKDVEQTEGCTPFIWRKDNPRAKTSFTHGNSRQKNIVSLLQLREKRDIPAICIVCHKEERQNHQKTFANRNNTSIAELPYTV
jgi:hypothetical protein